jgi:hypothetical protein
MKAIIIYSLALAALTSCAKSEEAITPDNPNNPLPPKEIHISAAIEASAQTKAVTRVNATLTGALDGTVDIPGIQFLKKDATNSTSLSFADATPYVGTRTANNNTGTGGDITFTSASQPQYSLVDQNAYFVAYYPAGTLDESAKTAAITIDGKTDILYTEIYDAGTYTEPKPGTTGSTHMTFKHALAQLEVICQTNSAESKDAVRDTWGQITKIELATNNTATYTYGTHVFTFSDTGSGTKLPLVNSDYKTDFATVDIPDGSSTPTTATAAGMFAPTTTASALSLTITTAKLTQTVTVNLYAESDTGESTQMSFEAGKTHKVTLTFNSTTKDITVTKTEVAAWGDGYKGTGDVKPDNATPVTP